MTKSIVDEQYIQGQGLLRYLLKQQELTLWAKAGEYLKTKKRCKTALVTELVHAWMKNGETAVNTVSSTGNINIEDIKRQLLQDKDFLSRIEKSMTETGNQNEPEAESEDNENLDMDEDMMLAGLSMFDSEI